MLKIYKLLTDSIWLRRSFQPHTGSLCCWRNDEKGLDFSFLTLHMRVYSVSPPGGCSAVHFSSVAQSCPTLCDPMNRSMPVLPVHHQLPEFTQTHAHRVGWCHPAISSSVVPFSFNPSQHQGLFQWVNSLHEVAKVLEFQLQHQSFQWTPRTDLL